MNRKITLVLLLVTLTFGAQEVLGLEGLPQHTPGVLEIHQVNVQQGDCTLIVGPDGTTVLIDAGNRGKGTAEVVPYLQDRRIHPEDGLDFVIVTHRDSDHLGGMDEVIKAGYDVVQGIWDNGSTKNFGPNSQIGQFLDEGSRTTAGRAQGNKVGKIPLGQTIQLGNGATATAVAVGGWVLGKGKVNGATEENDLSVGILVKYGNFEYLTAGDLGGGDDDFSCTGRKTNQFNVETPLATSLLSTTGASLLKTDGLEVLDINHHGSESSTNRDYMNFLSPTIAVINTGSGQGSTFHHPRADVVENVLMAQAGCVTARPALVLQTEDGSPTGPNTTFQGFSVGDIMIRTDGALTFEVFATGEVSQGIDERLAAGIGFEGRAFPLDGVSAPVASQLIITEIMRDPAAVPDTSGEWFEIHNPGTESIDINGWTIRDEDHDFHVILHVPELLVPPGGFLVLGRNGDPTQNGGYESDYTYSGVNLANTSDEIVIVDRSGREVDSVSYDGGAWPNPTGASIRLRIIGLSNDDAANWEISTSQFGVGDRGTPGEH